MFPLHVIIFSRRSQLLQGSIITWIRKDITSSGAFLCFLDHYCLFFFWVASSCTTESVASWAVSVPGIHSHRLVYLVLALNLAEFPCLADPLQFRVHRASWMPYVKVITRKRRYIYCVYLFCSHVALSHWTLQKFKHKSFKNYITTIEIQNSWDSSEHWVLCSCMGCTPWSWPFIIRNRKRTFTSTYYYTSS